MAAHTQAPSRQKARTTRAAEFSYAYLEHLLAIANERFELRPLAEAFKPSQRPGLVLRHDVDVSLDAALKVAELEARVGLRSSFLVLVDWPLYDIEAPEGREALRRLRELGHDVGLHVDPRTSAAANHAMLAAARDRVAAAAGAPVRSLSFHRPTRACFGRPPRIAGMVNAYAKPLMRSYLSDSRGRFRVGNPTRALLQTPGPIAQLLIHPIWWGEHHRSPAMRLRDLVRARTAELGPAGAQRYAAALIAAVTISPA